MSVIVADGLSVRERKGCLVESLVDGRWSTDKDVGWKESTLMLLRRGVFGRWWTGKDSAVRTVGLSGSEVIILLRLDGKRCCCWSVGRQSTTILFLTLEVANSKAKSGGIQI